MTVIGFDVSKHELVGVRVNRRASVQKEYIVPNQSDAIARFLDEIVPQHRRLLIASEATAEYHRPLAQACLKRGIPFRLLNPIITKQITRLTIRKKKTDLSDAWIIAKCALDGAGTAASEAMFSPAKTLLRTAAKLGILSGMLLRMERHIHETVPDTAEVAALLRELRKRTEKTMMQLRHSGSHHTDQGLARLLSSVPGIGATLAPVFIAELAPLERFKSQKALVAYAGLDPKVKQSGVSLKRNTHLTKRGSSYLRRAAYIAASIAQRHDPELKQYFEKKLGEGKRYREATIANARHILYRVYAVWKRETPYVPCGQLTT